MNGVNFVLKLIIDAIPINCPRTQQMLESNAI